MKIIPARHRGMCFGVRDAIALAIEQSHSRPLTILGDLVHNETVLDSLRQRGIQFQSFDQPASTQAVMVTAHGTSQKTLQQLQDQGREVLQATCPLVHLAHRALHQLVQAGCYPVIIGQRHHVEVRGMTGDLAEYKVVLTEEEVMALPERPRFGVVSQTTQPIARVRHLVDLLKARHPGAEVRFTDTVCQPTKNRQSAAEELARECDAMVVVGGTHSNNTRELVATCGRYCSRVYHVQTEQDLSADWFIGVGTVGVTAGTSTPDSVIAAVEARLAGLHVESKGAIA